MYNIYIYMYIHVIINGKKLCKLRNFFRKHIIFNSTVEIGDKSEIKHKFSVPSRRRLMYVESLVDGFVRLVNDIIVPRQLRNSHPLPYKGGWSETDFRVTSM